LGFAAKVSNAGGTFHEMMRVQLAGVLGADRHEIPQVFLTAAPRPLKIGTYQNLRERYPASRAKPLSQWLRRWTRSWQYLEAIDKGGCRVDLEGEPAGLITEVERACARAGLQQHKRKRSAKACAGGGVSSDPGRPVLRLPSLRRPAP
jgi:hypothetical protein